MSLNDRANRFLKKIWEPAEMENRYRNPYMNWPFWIVNLVMLAGITGMFIGVISYWDFSIPSIVMPPLLILGLLMFTEKIIWMFKGSKEIELGETIKIWNNFYREWEFEYGELIQMLTPRFSAALMVRLKFKNGETIDVGFGFKDGGEMLERILERAEAIEVLDIDSVLKPSAWGKLPDRELIDRVKERARRRTG